MLNLNIEQYGALKLDHKLAIYVPGTNGVDQEADNSEEVKKVAEIFSELFGGATATEASGFWHSETAGLVKERITIVYSNCTEEQARENIGKVLELAQELKTSMKQEAISIMADEVLYII